VARHLKSLSALLVILCFAGASACSGERKTGAPASTAPARGGSLTASIRSEPKTFNRFAPGALLAPVDVVSRLVHATLVRINRVTGEA